jgi:hypothetical protein
LTIIFGLDSEVWTVISSIALVGATSALATATWILGKSSRQHERLSKAEITALQAQTKSIETQTATLVMPKIGIRTITRYSDTVASVALRNVGLGPARLKIKLSSASWSYELPIKPNKSYSLAVGENQDYAFEIPKSLTEIDVKVTFTDMLGNEYSASATGKTITQIEVRDAPV